MMGNEPALSPDAINWLLTRALVCVCRWFGCVEVRGIVLLHLWGYGMGHACNCWLTLIQILTLGSGLVVPLMIYDMIC